MAIFELVFHDEMIQILHHIFKAFGLRAALLDTSFREQIPHGVQPVSGYCRLIQQELGLLEKCRENDRFQCMEAERTRTSRFYYCHAGLAEAVYPLFLREQCIGFIMVGQFRLTNGVPPHILSSAGDNLGNKLHEVYEKLPVYDPDILESVLKLIEISTRYILDHRIVSVRQNFLTDKVISFIRNTITENPGLRDVSEAVHASVSTVNHSLKAVTGKSFKQLQIELKMEKAEFLLREKNFLISEVAGAVGYDDPLYFSRRFKKYSGLSPREFRKNKVDL